MLIGMARKIMTKVGADICVAVTLGFFAISASLAQDEGVPETAPSLSPACEVPASNIAAPASLPNTAAALQARKVLRILAIGSSSTLGVGASSDSKSYPSQLEPILEGVLKGVDVIISNRGVPGEVAKIAAERIKSEIAREKPDLVLWQLGTNDVLARVSTDEFEETVRSTIRQLKENKIDIVLVGLQYTPRFAADMNSFAIRDILKRIAAYEQILYVRRDDAMRFIVQTRADLKLMSRDNFHLNDLGYRCMAEHIAYAVIGNLLAKQSRPAEN
jgi:acyl-CoA thioesterase-1